MLALVLCVIVWILCVDGTFDKIHSDYARSIDEGIAYGQIVPYKAEWDNFIGNHSLLLSPMHFWFRCIEREVRGYFFIEDLGDPAHGKEAIMLHSGHIAKTIKITADGAPATFRSWHGGGDFMFNISINATRDHYVDVMVDGFKHYTRFPVALCTARPKPSTERKYVMHIHLRDFSVKHEFKPTIIDGLANHMAYHRCALKLDKYEVVVQGEVLPQFLSNEKIAHAVKEGWITFLVRNPVIPSPLMQKGSASNCYYQAYTQNMAILQHWQENVKLYFFDTDEYLSAAGDVTGDELMRIVEAHSSVGFVRFMVFCDSCPKDRGEEKVMSLSRSSLVVNSKALRDKKLVVDPNRVGCYIIHWAGCGDKTVHTPPSRAHILHFENLYAARWRPSQRSKMNTTALVPSKINTLCDPTVYDWRSPLPSFHASTVG